MFLRKARYYSSVSGINLALLLCLVYIVNPFLLLPRHPQAAAAVVPVIKPVVMEKPRISGKPVRIVISSVQIDLTVDEGSYNPADDSWSLSGYHAQYATTSAPANDRDGGTFIYGHNNKFV